MSHSRVVENLVWEFLPLIICQCVVIVRVTVKKKFFQLVYVTAEAQIENDLSGLVVSMSGLTLERLWNETL